MSPHLAPAPRAKLSLRLRLVLNKGTKCLKVWMKGILHMFPLNAFTERLKNELANRQQVASETASSRLEKLAPHCGLHRSNISLRAACGKH